MFVISEKNYYDHRSSHTKQATNKMHWNCACIPIAILYTRHASLATKNDSNSITNNCCFSTVPFSSSSSISLHLLFDKVKIILKHIICSNITGQKVIKWKNGYFNYIFCTREARTKERRKIKQHPSYTNTHTHMLRRIGFSSSFYSHDVIVRALHIDVFTFDD